MGGNWWLNYGGRYEGLEAGETSYLSERRVRANYVKLITMQRNRQVRRHRAIHVLRNILNCLGTCVT